MISEILEFANGVWAWDLYFSKAFLVISNEDDVGVTF